MRADRHESLAGSSRAQDEMGGTTLRESNECLLDAAGKPDLCARHKLHCTATAAGPLVFLRPLGSTQELAKTIFFR
eukprot:Skav231593  [mRNA]  locus=scaffold232:225655:231778:+ [translate_table: standard]